MPLTPQMIASVILLLQAFGIGTSTIATVQAELAPQQQAAPQSVGAITLEANVVSAPVCGTSSDVPTLSVVPESTSTELVNGKNYYFDVTATSPCLTAGTALWSVATPNPASSFGPFKWSRGLAQDNPQDTYTWSFGFVPTQAGNQTIAVNVDGATASYTATATTTPQ